MLLPKVCCLMPTYGRFHLAQRAMSFFLDQTYPNKEMVIFNQNPVPMMFDHPDILIVNTHTYDRLDQVYIDAVKHCDGELLCVWDDDNGAFPWFLEETIRYKTMRAAKMSHSWCWTQGKLDLTQNMLESSIVMDRDVVDEFGFKGRSLVHLEWYFGLERQHQLQWIPIERQLCLCCVLGDPVPEVPIAPCPRCGRSLHVLDAQRKFLVDEPESKFIKSTIDPGFVYVWGGNGPGCWHISCISDQDKGFETYREKSTDFGDGKLQRVDVRPWYDMVTKNHSNLRSRLWES